MNQEEYLELLVFIRERLRELGRTDIDELAYSVAERAEFPSAIVLAYLESVYRQFALESKQGVRAAIERVQEHIQTDQDPISDILIIPTEGGDEFRRDAVSLLAVFPDRTEFLEEFGSFLTELRHDREDFL